MTAASENAAPDRERAETYLRLQSEAELRRALAMPEYKQPREPAPAAIFNAVVRQRRMWRRRAAVRRVMRQQGSGSTPASSQGGRAIQASARAIAWLPVIRRAAKSLAGTRTVVAAPAARLLQSAATTRYQLSARVSHATWRLRPGFRGRGYDAPPAQACLTRVETLAAVLAAVGAITTETEENVVDGLRTALAARSRIEQDTGLGYHRFGGHRMRRPAARTQAPYGPPRALPVGLPANGEIEGVAVRFYLGVLVIDQGSVTLTVRARFPVELIERDHGHMDPVFHALSETSAVDDRGGTYHAHFSGGGGGGEWDGRFHLSPTPPPGVRWLDMTLPGAPAVRVRLDVAPRDLQITTEEVTTSAADRFLDARALQVLCRKPTDLDWASDDDDSDLPPLFRVASLLVAAGVLRTDSPSLRRLAAVAVQMGEHLPRELSLIQPDALPADWLSLQAAQEGREDGPVGMITVAAVLPEVDGVRCVLGELVSDADSATMQVHASGWLEPRQPGGVRSEQVWWSARDDLGGRYIVGEGGWSSSDSEADLDLEFSPAINPQARVLDIILTGTATQVTVSVPLDWQEAL